MTRLERNNDEKIQIYDVGLSFSTYQDGQF